MKVLMTYYLTLLAAGTFLSQNCLVTALQPSRKAAKIKRQKAPDTFSHISRRCFLIRRVPLFTASVLGNLSPVSAVETVGKDPNCNDSTCLGVWDGLLADCPHGERMFLRKFSGAGCTSSQDDTPGIFSEPWDYSEAPNNSLDWKNQMELLVPSIERVSARRGDLTQVLQRDGRYLRVKFRDKKSSEESVGEFYFTPDDSTVQFRIASTANNIQISLSSLKNMDRAEMIRKELRYTKVPVLRNRSRILFFGESDLDTFGPGSAMLGPPEEMTNGELEGRLSDNVVPKKSDFLQKFPREP